jgi:hypothetical protein
MSEIQDAVAELTDLGAEVLSPADPRVVDSFGGFLYVASDRLRAIRTVQSRHLAAIEASDFVWLVAPDGYVGTSAAMEIGFASAVETPVFTDSTPSDLTLRQYVTTISSIAVAINRIAEPGDEPYDVLLDPSGAVERAHAHLDFVERELIGPHSHEDSLVRASAREVTRILRRV